MGSAGPVTVVITRRVRSGCRAEFERVMAALRGAASAFPGHRGGFLIPPESGNDEGPWRMLFAFDSPAQLQRWTDSRERRELLEQLAALTHADSAMRVMSGLETWFALPGHRTQQPPPRWKMALVGWLGNATLVWLAAHTVAPKLQAALPPTASLVLLSGLVVAAMTWFAMPLLARAFAAWLYPEPEAPDSPTALEQHR